MAMGIVSDSDFEKEISRSTPIPSVQKPEIKPTHNGGRNVNDVNVPPSIRQIIGDEAVTNGRKAALDLAHSLGISDSSASAYANGAHSTANYNSPNPDLKKSVLSAKQRVAIKARNRLNQTLTAITPEKLEKAKLRDLAGMATAMASVVKTMEGDSKDNEDDDGQKRPIVVLFAPKQRKEEEYETVVVND